MIESLLTDHGISCAAQRGETKDVDRFRDDPTCRVLVAHPRSGGVGLNLQCANTVVFFGHGQMGAAMRAQAEARLHRQGQEQPVLVVDLLARGSIDVARLDRAKDKKEMLGRITGYIQGRRRK